MAAIPFKEKQRNKRIRDGVVDMYRQFVSEVDPKNVFDLLIQKRVINIEQKEEFMIKVTKKERCRALLDHLLYSSNNESFIVLRDALEDQYHWIVERIDQYKIKSETTNISDANSYKNKMTQTEHQEHLEDPVHVDLPSDARERVKKESDCGIENTNLGQKLEQSRKENKDLEQKLNERTQESQNLEQDLQESRNENANLDFDKALDREKNLKKELDAIRSRIKSLETCQKLLILLRKAENHSDVIQHLHQSLKLFDSKVFVFGIDDGDSITQNIININLNRSDDVSEAHQIPFEMKYGSAAAVLCDSIFVTGIGKKCDEIWRFNVTSSKWKKRASLDQCRLFHSVAFVDHILYIGGGWVDSEEKTLTDDVEAYDTHKDQCVSVGKLAIAFYGSGNCVPFKSSLYVFGGYGANYITVNKVQVYDTKLNTCTLLSKPMPIVYCHLRAVLWENTVILLGYDDCFTYNFETQVWEARDHFQTDVGCFGLTIGNGLLFVIGGGVKKVDADGNIKWTCRDDVRCIPLVNFLNNEPIDWRHHATLPKPSLVNAFGQMDFVLK